MIGYTWINNGGNYPVFYKNYPVFYPNLKTMMKYNSWLTTTDTVVVEINIIGIIKKHLGSFYTNCYKIKRIVPREEYMRILDI